jgi:hypothetical protein
VPVHVIYMTMSSLRYILEGRSDRTLGPAFCMVNVPESDASEADIGELLALLWHHIGEDFHACRLGKLPLMPIKGM